MKRQFELDLIVKSMDLLRELGLCPERGKGTLQDIGANIRVISIGFLHTGEMEKAAAVEPAPRNFALLEKNVEQNGFKNRILCFRNAVSDLDATVELELSDTNAGDHRVRVQSAGDTAELFQESKRAVEKVETLCVDTILERLPTEFSDDIAALRVDVQGHEGHVFRGASRLLAKGLPTMAEIWPYGIVRSGASLEDFHAIVSRYWSDYWVIREGQFVRYPIALFNGFLAELGGPKEFENVVFTRDPKTSSV